jgi:hypothetical protein
MHRAGREAQGLEARTLQNLVATAVASCLLKLLVMRPIRFHDEPSAQADEVWIIPQQWGLPPNVKAMLPQRPQPHPQAHLLDAHRLP